MGKLTNDEKSAIAQASDFIRRGDIAAAERLFHAAMESNDKNPVICMFIGYEYIEHEMNEEAIYYFRRAIELDELCKYAWGGVGRALMDLERWDEAEAALRHRLELGESATHYVFLATVLTQQARYEEVLSCCARALQLDDRQLDALLNQGIAYSSLGLHEKAVEACRRAISIDSAYDESYVCLGVVLSRANKLDDALDAFQRAIDINPQCAAAYREFGVIQYFKGDLVLAKSYLQSGVDLGRGKLSERGGNREAESILDELEENSVGD